MLSSRAANIVRRRVAREKRHRERDKLERKKRREEGKNKCEWSCDHVHDSLLLFASRANAAIMTQCVCASKVCDIIK